jgi:hypothetical protein
LLTITLPFEANLGSSRAMVGRKVRSGISNAAAKNNLVPCWVYQTISDAHFYDPIFRSRYRRNRGVQLLTSFFLVVFIVFNQIPVGRELAAG